MSARGRRMLAKDEWREELAEQGFVPYGEVVRLRRLCWLAWALMVVILIAVLGGWTDVLGSSGAASQPGDSQPSRQGHLEASSVRQLRRVPRLGSPLGAFEFEAWRGRLKVMGVRLLQVVSN